ncbi:MAG: FG-GAP repeat protein [Blastocatellales bacterium]|nr:FG-GAP repeat protein [Blastocatellales bacterium]
MPSLQGQPATDYLKKEGLFEKVKAAIEADRRELRRVKEEGVKGAGTVWEARHQGRNLRAMFTREGVRLTPVENCAGEKWQAAVSLKGVGYGEKLKRAVAGPMRVEGNRIELQKLIVDGVGEGQGAAITEWYVNKEQGIEQGFTLAERPGESGGAFVGAEPLRVVMSVSGGLRARVEDGGQAVALRYEKGSQVLRYDHLAAWDARGRWLPSHMEASGKGDEITLVVEDAGAVYPVTIDPLFTEVKKLIASDGAAGDRFGFSVSISGDTVVVGAPLVDSFRGAAYIYERNKGGMGLIADNWGEVKKLTASDGAANDFFGISVGISGDTVVVGAQDDDSGRGAAYVYERNKGGMGPAADNWGEVKKLTASDGAVNDRFGISVSISGDTVVVGAFGDDSKRGAAYIYERNKGAMGPEADNWGEVKKLTASDGAADDQFGNSVSISGDTVVVGAYFDDSLRGAAYIYERNKGGADNWGEVKKLTASDGAADDRLGISVGISGDTVVVGAVGDDSNRGAAYIYERNKGGMGPIADNWGEVRKLTASDGVAGDFFGVSVSISGDTVVVGAVGDDSARGAAYIYERNKGGMGPIADNWGEVKKLRASDGAADDRFGQMVSISGDTVVVGAAGDDSARGAAYTFVSECNLVEKQKRTASDGAADDAFGFSVSISGDTVVVGAQGDDSGRGAAGSLGIAVECPNILGSMNRNHLMEHSHGYFD